MTDPYIVTCGSRIHTVVTPHSFAPPYTLPHRITQNKEFIPLRQSNKKCKIQMKYFLQQAEGVCLYSAGLIPLEILIPEINQSSRGELGY